MSQSSSPSYRGLRQELHLPDPVFGAFMTIPDPGLAGIVGWSGFDLVVLDTEHGPFSPSSTRGCIDALAASPARSAIRVPDIHPAVIKQAVDLGPDGILLPMVSDAASAAAAVRASRYAPDGSRGIGAGHASRYGTNMSEYLAEANSKLAVMVVIETASGVESAAEIASVSGLDAIVIGATDLAADLGHLGDSGHERVKEAIDSVIGAATDAGVKVGIGCDASAITDLAGSGLSLFACYFDGSAVAASAARALEEAKQGWAKES